MRIIARATLKNYVAGLHGQKDQRAVGAAVNAWFHEVCQANWGSSADVKKQYASASILNNSRIVFNIKGNDYRLIISVNYIKSIVWIIWLGTHKEYDKINAAGVKYDGRY